MRRSLVFGLLVLGLTPLACSGGERETTEGEPGAATTTTAETVTLTETTTTTVTGESEASAAVVAGAALRTADAGSSRVVLSASVGGRKFSAEGAFDYEEHNGAMTLDLGGLGAAIGADALDVVFVHNVVYYHLPAGTLPAGKEWMRIDVRTLADASGVDFQQLAQASQSDPAQYLRWLQAAGDEVEEVGEATVRGVEATQYGASVDLADLAGAVDPEVREATRLWAEALREQLGVDEVPTDVWIDEDGLVRRIRQRYDLRVGERKVRTEIAMELFDFGVEVDVEAPPADAVVDLGDLLGQT